MGLFEAIVLGVVQGLTEFLPVSSSGHLVIVRVLLGVEEPSLTFDVMVHFGTLFAVLIALKDDWMPMIKGLFHRSHEGEEARRSILHIIIATIPIGLAGLMFKDSIEAFFASASTAGWMLLVTGIILWLADGKARQGSADRQIRSMGLVDALVIGIGQAMALLPGLSRSGSTIGAGMLRGFHREGAARFAFLLAIPAILGATVLQAPSAFGDGESMGVLAVGTITAGISGYFAINLFLRFLRRGSLRVFSYYTWIVGLLVIVLT